MVNIILNGLPVKVEEGITILEASRFYGFPVPTLCHMDGLSSYGACRLCVVEIGEDNNTRLVTSCTHPVEENQIIRTASQKVIKVRKMIIELLLASCPQSRKIQDLASAFGVRQQRFRQQQEDCILCGLCVRICEEQMMAGAIGFRGRGDRRSIGTPYDVRSETCRACGACMYICPACQLRCTFNEPEKAVCGACANLSPPCLDKKHFEDMMCYMSPCVACEIKES